MTFRLRRLLALPWLILALLLQANAPAQAAGMAAAMLGQPDMDAGMAMPLCGDKGQAPLHEPQKDCCAGCLVCAVAHAAAPLSDAPAPPPPQVRALVTPVLVGAHSPRGPPSIRPKARGPPILI